MKFAKSLAAMAVCLGVFLALSGPAAAGIIFEDQGIFGDGSDGETYCTDTFCFIDSIPNISTSYGKSYNITIKMPEAIQHFEVTYYIIDSFDWYATDASGKVWYLGGVSDEGLGDVPLTIRGEL